MPLSELKTGFTQFSTVTVFSYMLWHIALKVCIWLCSTILQIKFECHQFPSIFVGVIPLLALRILEIHCDSFPHFPLTCFDILSCFCGDKCIPQNAATMLRKFDMKQILYVFYQVCPPWADLSIKMAVLDSNWLTLLHFLSEYSYL